MGKGAGDGEGLAGVLGGGGVDGDDAPIEGELVVGFDVVGQGDDRHFGPVARDEAGGDSTGGEGEDRFGIEAVGGADCRKGDGC